MQFIKEEKGNNILIMRGKKLKFSRWNNTSLWMKKFGAYWWWLHYLLIKTNTFNVENLAPVLANPSFCPFSLNGYILQTIYRADPQKFSHRLWCENSLMSEIFQRQNNHIQRSHSRITTLVSIYLFSKGAPTAELTVVKSQRVLWELALFLDNHSYISSRSKLAIWKQRGLAAQAAHLPWNSLPALTPSCSIAQVKFCTVTSLA